MKLLHIDSSISGAQSISRQFTTSIVARLKATSPGLVATYRELAAVPVPHQSPSIQFSQLKVLHKMGPLSGDIGEMVAAAVQGVAQVEPSAQAEFAEINVALEEFLTANTIVLGAPMYNFGIASQLKAWIDCLAAPDKTFNYTAPGVEGLAGGQKIIIASSRGGFYAALSPMAAMDHQETFLSSFLGLISITDITFLRAERVNIGRAAAAFA